jgi:stage V sporulation protein G
MEITEVNVFRVDVWKLKAYATITFDHVFIIRDLKIIKGKKGLFIEMPNKRNKKGILMDVVQPLNQHMRHIIQQKVIEKYISNAGSDARKYI